MLASSRSISSVVRRSMEALRPRHERERTSIGIYRAGLRFPLLVAASSLIAAVGSLLFGARLGAEAFNRCVFPAALIAPYAIYRLVVHYGWPPQTNGDYRRVLFVAPIGAIAVLGAGGAILLLVVGHRVDASAIFSAFAELSTAFLILGYLYAWCIELAVSELERKRLLRTGTPIDAE